MIIYLILLLVILFAGAKISQKDEFHEDFLSLKISKGIQGITAIAIIFHHCTQTIVDAKQDAGIMYMFNFAGYLLVAIFFFFSGYGLYVSYKNKKDYLKGFLKKRLPTVLVPLVFINAIYTVVWLIGGNNLYNDLNPLTLGLDNIFFRITTFLCITLMNGNLWFVITIALFYIMFYFIFKNSKDENSAIRNMGIGVVLYAVLGMCVPPIGLFWFEGEWWYDSSFIFFLGIFAAKNKQKIIAVAKEKYKILLPLSFIGTAVVWAITIYLDRHIGAYGHGLLGAGGALLCYLSKTAVEILFVSFVLLLSMKIRANNKALDFLGQIAFEVYLIHGLYIDVFRSDVINIESPVLFFAVIIVCTLISAWILNIVDSKLVKAIKNCFKKDRAFR